MTIFGKINFSLLDTATRATRDTPLERARRGASENRQARRCGIAGSPKLGHTRGEKSARPMGLGDHDPADERNSLGRTESRKHCCGLARLDDDRLDLVIRPRIRFDSHGQMLAR